MGKKLIILVIAVISLFAMPHSAQAEPKKLTIVFSGDMRGELENCHCPKDDFGGLPRRAQYIDEVRSKTDEILLLDVGDVLPLSTAENSQRDISYSALVAFKAMKLMGYAVMNVGESDLILGEDFLKQKENVVSFPFVSANIVDKFTGKTFFQPYVIKAMENGLRVGIIGVVNERYIINSDQLEILPHKQAIEWYMPELEAKSDVVIVLGHLGLPYSEELANYVEGIDVILSGHWDVDTQEPIKVGDTIIMPTTYNSRKIGRLDIEVENGIVSSYKWESTPLGEEYDGNELVEKLISKRPDFKKKKTAKMLLPLENFAVYGDPLKVFVFYSPGCRSCMEVEKEVLPKIIEKYSNDISIEHLDISVSKNYEQMIRLEKLYNVQGGGYVPEVIVSRYVLIGKKDIETNLGSSIEKSLNESVKKKDNGPLEAVKYHPPETISLILSRFNSFSVYTVMAAGLLDGINPCAFTTIVFFISFLSFVGYRRREMFFAGTSFTVAVFIAYLLIGLGIFRFLRTLKGFEGISSFVNIAIGGLAFLLAALSLVDYFRFKKSKDVKSIILKLPNAIRNKIHSIIGTDFRQEANKEKKQFFKIIWVAFTAGFMVSILESFCTGQVYLPTIAFVLRMPDKRVSAYGHLILYNLAFIIPLIVVFLMGLYGVTSKSFSAFMERRMGAIKLSLAALFFLLGSMIIIFR